MIVNNQFHVYLDGQYYKSVNDLFTVELELGTALKQLSFNTNRRVFITLSDDYVAEDFLHHGNLHIRQSNIRRVRHG